VSETWLSCDFAAKSAKRLAVRSETQLTNAWNSPRCNLGRLITGEAVTKKHAYAIARPAIESDFHARRVASLERRPYFFDILLLESHGSYHAQSWQHNLLIEDRQFSRPDFDQFGWLPG
jgi:hypothetical protein